MTDEWIFQELRRIRKERGLTQAETAKGAGVTIRVFRNWEDGTVDPSARKLFKWARFLGYEFDMLLIDRRREAAE